MVSHCHVGRKPTLSPGAKQPNIITSPFDPNPYFCYPPTSPHLTFICLLSTDSYAMNYLFLGTFRALSPLLSLEHRWLDNSYFWFWWRLALPILPFVKVNEVLGWHVGALACLVVWWIHGPWPQFIIPVLSKLHWKWFWDLLCPYCLLSKWMGFLGYM